MKYKLKDYVTSNVIGNAMSLIIAIIFFVLISNFNSINGFIKMILSVISPFIYGFVLAYLLNKPVIFFEKKVFQKFPEKYIKNFSIFSTYILFFIIMLALCLAIIPQAWHTLISILDNIPFYIENLTNTISNLLERFEIDADVTAEISTILGSVTQFVTNFDSDFFSKILSASISFGAVILNMITSLIASIYMLMSKKSLILQIKKIFYAFLSPSHVENLLSIGSRLDKIFSSFIIGKMIDSVIIGCICFVGMMFIYSPFALLIGVIIGITNMIPYFGPFIGAIPCGFILLLVNPMTTVIFGLFIIVLQQVDGNIIGPKILGDSTGLSAFWVLASIIIGGGLFDIVGMIIGVPVFAVIYSIVAEVIHSRLDNRNIEIDINGNFKSNYLDDDTIDLSDMILEPQLNFSDFIIEDENDFVIDDEN